jgi:cytochrome c
MGDCRHCSDSFNLYDVGAGCRCRRAGVHAIVLPCHDIGPEAKIKLGPPLNAIDGRKAGTFEGFNYSPVNKSSGITWNEQAFDKYIRAPMQEMPGTRMAFVGIKNDKDITDVWAYLKQFGPDGVKK